ncbi:hypothetical protein MLD38_012033 [Melastoma candidum]|uniref:Uncharacterized protein n=1 Tax=Melastoma candidum TaxID=119954 RepID=A0ACB9R544_9MYRT|nr:hypothetical protein MLD38_012033 [Melastoma candidum]
MSVEVLLQPQDCLSPQSVIRNSNNNFHRDARSVAFNGNRRFNYDLPEPSVSSRSNATTGGHLGRPMILRRGESTRSRKVVTPVDEVGLRRGPLYAGSAFNVSPEPSTLPLPSFSRKKDTEDCATRDLRRLLRLEEKHPIH